MSPPRRVDFTTFPRLQAGTNRESLARLDEKRVRKSLLRARAYFPSLIQLSATPRLLQNPTAFPGFPCRSAAMKPIRGNSPPGCRSTSAATLLDLFHEPARHEKSRKKTRGLSGGLPAGRVIRRPVFRQGSPSAFILVA